ncbi:MAG TPA: GlsB/YeaQ/YmgE family stress response membrane protein [Polyangium sp.]|nr:GlsB/YeaQ/YmgE family stress response membrane protein [Polyangium sp.]
MSILAWIVLGLIAGFLGSKVVDNRGQGVLGDIIVGVVGAFLGGFLFSVLGGSGITGFNLYSLFVAVIGSIVLLAILNAVRPRRAG